MNEEIELYDTGIRLGKNKNITLMWPKSIENLTDTQKSGLPFISVIIHTCGIGIENIIIRANNFDLGFLFINRK